MIVLLNFLFFFMSNIRCDKLIWPECRVVENSFKILVINYTRR
jgi:hypothetical protein